MIHALLLEDDPEFARSLVRAMAAKLEIVVTWGVAQARDALTQEIDVVLADLFLGPASTDEPEGLAFVRWVQENRPEVPVIVITGHADMRLAIEALRAGVDDFLEKGRLGIQEIDARISAVLERRLLRHQVENLEARLDLYEPRRLTGSSPLVEDVRRTIQSAAADGVVTVLLRGESGTGKELAARMIHSGGPRKSGPFVAVDVSTLPRDTLASELFGYERGAFTGAERAHTGYIEAANRGVLLLDEIGELPRDTQTSLFRVLEERAVTRLGSTRPRPVDVQLLAATTQDLEVLVQKGEFRAELYYRLRVFEIRLPALREHPGDIPELVEFFLGMWRRAGRTGLRVVPPDVMDALQRYSWPGNVRELRNTLEAASVRARMAHATALHFRFLPPEIHAPPAAAGAEQPPGVEPAGSAVEESTALAELACVAGALRSARFRKDEARKIAGYNSRHTMRRRLAALRERFPEIWCQFPELERAYPGKQPKQQ